MSIYDFSAIKDLNLKDVEGSIGRYSKANGPWLRQFDTYFWQTRSRSNPQERLISLLEIVRGSGWNMNRQGQCTHITQGVKSGSISEDQLQEFWEVIDSLPDLKLRDFPYADPEILKRMKVSFDTMRRTLYKWHACAGTICFLTKVILMFNWGQTPALDTRVRSILRLKSEMSTAELMQLLIDIGYWIVRFEKDNGVQLDEFSTSIMNRECSRSLQPLPLGRSFDMIMFSLV
jgi:hypothetical protein